VGQGGIFANGHNVGEGQFRSAVLAEKAFDIPADFRFAAAGSKLALNPLQHLVVEREGFFHRGHLHRLLDTPQAFHQPVGRFNEQSWPRRGEVAGKGLAYALSLNAHADAAAAQQAVQLLGSAAAINENAVMVPKPFGGIQIAGVGCQPVAPVGGDDKPSGAFVELGIVQLESRKVKPVGRLADEQSVEAAFAHGPPQFFAAGSKNFIHTDLLRAE